MRQNLCYSVCYWHFFLRNLTRKISRIHCHMMTIETSVSFYTADLAGYTT